MLHKVAVCLHRKSIVPCQDITNKSRLTQIYGYDTFIKHSSNIDDISNTWQIFKHKLKYRAKPAVLEVVMSTGL